MDKHALPADFEKYLDWLSDRDLVPTDPSPKRQERRMEPSTLASGSLLSLCSGAYRVS